MAQKAGYDSEVSPFLKKRLKGSLKVFHLSAPVCEQVMKGETETDRTTMNFIIYRGLSCPRLLPPISERAEFGAAAHHPFHPYHIVRQR